MDDEPRVPANLERHAADSLPTLTEGVRRTVAHTWIEKDWRLVVVTAAVIVGGPIVSGLIAFLVPGLPGAVLGTVTGILLGLAASLLGYRAVAKRVDCETA